MRDVNTELGRILKQQRLSLPLTLRELSAMSGVSASHLGRIERGERFPSGSILRRIAKPLGFEEDELFTLAGYLSPPTPSVAEGRQYYGGGELDPYVARMLTQEPVEMQRAIVGILSILKSIAKGITKADTTNN
jgi:transcriptional regulator with XRE-family HTH domain